MRDISRWSKLKCVTGPDGNPLTLSDLPPVGNRRWYERQKANVVAAVRGGLIALEDVMTRYRISAEEFECWQRAYKRRVSAARERGLWPAFPAAKTFAGDAQTPAIPFRHIVPPGRRIAPLNGEEIISSGALTVNLRTRIVQVHGRSVRLTRGEYRILELLCLHKGNTVTESMLLNRIASRSEVRPSKVIEVYICRLRKKLAPNGSDEPYIVTIWGRGYALYDPEARPSGRGGSA